MERSMYFLEQKDMPTHWYNIMADMPGDMPYVLHPGTGKPATADDAKGLFPEECDVPGGSCHVAVHGIRDRVKSYENQSGPDGDR